jgi:DNA polymerase
LADGDGGPPIEAPEWALKAASLDELEKEAARCTLCTLCQGRKAFFFGRGKALRPDVMFVVSPPGKAAAKEGRFPAGKEGALLSSLVTSGFKKDEKDVYVTPAVKCAADSPSELPRRALACCRFIALRQAQLVAPRAVVAFGKDAARVMSGVDRPLGVLRKLGRLKLSGGGWLAGLWMTYGLDRMLATDQVREQAWEDLRRMAASLRRRPGGSSGGA